MAFSNGATSRLAKNAKSAKEDERKWDGQIPVFLRVLSVLSERNSSLQGQSRLRATRRSRLRVSVADFSLSLALPQAMISSSERPHPMQTLRSSRQQLRTHGDASGPVGDGGYITPIIRRRGARGEGPALGLRARSQCERADRVLRSARPDYRRSLPKTAAVRASSGSPPAMSLRRR